MVLLDGKEVEDNIITPEKHKFIGIFRKPNPYPSGIYDVCICNCGRHLWAKEDIYAHWLLGHFDICQYISINNDKN